MTDSLFTLADVFDHIDELIPVVAIAGSLLFGIVAFVSFAISSTIRGSQTERTRREIAAYIAEGSMTTEEGERLLNAGTQPKKPCC